MKQTDDEPINEILVAAAAEFKRLRQSVERFSDGLRAQGKDAEMPPEGSEVNVALVQMRAFIEKLFEDRSAYMFESAWRRERQRQAQEHKENCSDCQERLAENIKAGNKYWKN